MVNTILDMDRTYHVVLFHDDTTSIHYSEPCMVTFMCYLPSIYLLCAMWMLALVNKVNEHVQATKWDRIGGMDACSG